MHKPLDILKQYWGYDQFRPLQADIIAKAIDGQDVLALLPTGGGKSLCYQVPGMCMEGVTIVISPLIALMKDQVEQLQQRNIPAATIHSGLHFREIDILLNEAMAGKLKFLYLAPERLQTEIFQARFPQMPVNLVAIDEAHCISQWGYDFRPSYMEIAKIRELKADVPFIALTASATLKVREDILKNLELKSPQIFVKSFARDNLTFAVRKVEDKQSKLLEIISKLEGTGLVYCRSRKGTQEVAKLLQSQGMSADYYHAGLDASSRSRKQEDWIGDKTRIMACTNAFGMGIDKAEVRFVVHWDMPDSPEAYYQEAGRAGRDGKPSFAVLLYQEKDILELREWKEKAWPDEKTIRQVYQSIANYYQIAVGSHQMAALDFDLEQFSRKANISAVKVFHSIKKLEDEGYILLTDGFYQPSRFMFSVNNKELYEFQVANSHIDSLVKILLRMYGGEAFSQYMNIVEEKIAKALFISLKEVAAKLDWLKEREIIYYEKRSDKARLVFTLPRHDAASMPLDIVKMKARKAAEMARVEAMISYAQDKYLCRSLRLQNYFGEESLEACGKCDLCRGRNKENKIDNNKIERKLNDLLGNEPLLPSVLAANFDDLEQTAVLHIIRHWLDAGLVKYDQNGRIALKG